MTFLLDWNIFIYSEFPLLPVSTSLFLALKIEWAIVMTGALIFILSSQSIKIKKYAALLVVIFSFLPNQFSFSYWLGLAFQMPSIASVLLSSIFLNRIFATTIKTTSSEGRARKNWTNIQACAGVILGYLLLLDTFAKLPFHLYNFGFSPISLIIVAIFLLLPALLLSNSFLGFLKANIFIISGILVFLFARLPTGNVWDAVLDPWLWLILHIYLLRLCFKPSRRRPVPV